MRSLRETTGEKRCGVGRRGQRVDSARTGYVSMYLEGSQYGNYLCSLELERWQQRFPDFRFEI